MHFSLIDYMLWLPSAFFQVGVVVSLFRRGLHREYPYFFNYTILQVLTVTFLLCVQRSPYLYYYGYWGISAVSVLISFAVLQEIFKDAFRPYEALRDLSVILFRWSILVLLLVGGMWAVNTPHADHADLFNAMVLLADRSVRLMQCGLVFFLLFFSEYLGISRRHVLFGIALGFGLFASVNMLTATGMSHAGHGLLLRRINCAAYDVAALLWLAYTAFAPVRSSVNAAARSPEWNSALEDAKFQPPADSLLDTMDRTVERLLYPKNEVKINASVGTRL
ncbi:MAG: hypothetical protein WBM04_09495 [Candidatus Korobacteraceae bacterium]